MKTKRSYVGFILILIGLLMLIIWPKVLLGLSIIIMAIGVLSILNSREDKIEEINYSKMKQGGKNGKK